jgi:hypothetical protein
MGLPGERSLGRGKSMEILYKWRDQWNDASMNGGKCIIFHALNG